jgi:hypothetical protein
MTAPRITAIKPDSVHHVYSGRANRCCCGCSGTHTYDDQAKGPGYTVPRTSHSSIARTVKKMNRMIAEGCEVEFLGTCITVETDTRIYVAYYDH